MHGDTTVAMHSCEMSHYLVVPLIDNDIRQAYDSHGIVF